MASEISNKVKATHACWLVYSLTDGADDKRLIKVLSALPAMKMNKALMNRRYNCYQ